MNSLTMTPHAPASGRRQGRSRACSPNQSITAEWRAAGEATGGGAAESTAAAVAVAALAAVFPGAAVYSGAVVLFGGALFEGFGIAVMTSPILPEPSDAGRLRHRRRPPPSAAPTPHGAEGGAAATLRHARLPYPARELPEAGEPSPGVHRTGTEREGKGVRRARPRPNRNDDRQKLR